MKKDDYKSDFEENRKDIKIDEDALPSRMEKYGKNRKVKKKSGNLTINVILGLFTLIPVIILIYVISDFYAPSPGITAGIATDEVQIEKDESAKGSTNKKNADSGNTPDKKVDKTTVTASTSKPAVNVNPSTGSGKEQASKPEAKPETKPTPKPETKPVVKPKPETKPEAKPVSKTHTVATNENLYRIALKYYGNGSDATVAKLRAANGLGTNEIRVGQNLIIP